MLHVSRKAALFGAVALCFGAGVARAQTAGEYIGTTTDGNGITVTVGDDGNGGLAVTALNYGITALCQPGASTFNTGWGLPEFAEITDGTATLASFFQYIDTKANFSFSGTSVTGKIASITPNFAPYPANTKPTRSVLCTSNPQNFTATLSTGMASVPRLQHGTATLYLPPAKK